MNAKEYISGLASEGATLVVVPGTDDKGAKNLGQWLAWFFALFSRIVVIDYPGTVGPLIGGWRADSYDKSCDKAIVATVETVKAIAGKVIILGYSQGAEAAWLAAARLHQLGSKPDSEIELIVWAHPQHPTGIKAGLKRHHLLVSLLLRLFCGACVKGASDERQTGSIRVTSIAITGDPVTAFEVWWKNPLGFVLNSLAGFFMIHAGLGHRGAAHISTLGILGAWSAQGSLTVHAVVDTVHPVVQLLRSCGFRPNVRVQQFVAMITPLTVPGQRSASIFAVRRNWRSAKKLELAEVRSLSTQPKEEARMPETYLASAS